MAGRLFARRTYVAITRAKETLTVLAPTVMPLWRSVGEAISLPPARAAQPTLKTTDVSWRERFPDADMVATWDGGGMFSAQKGERFYAIQDESAMASSFPGEDLGPLIQVHEFGSVAERDRFVEGRGAGTKNGRR
jgi:hypothetical protein